MNLVHPRLTRRELAVVTAASAGLILFHSATSQSDSSGIPMLPGSPRPVETPQSDAWTSISLVRPGDLPFRLEAVPGRVLIVALWGAFCPSCREELAPLMRLRNLFGRGAVGVVLVGHPQFWAEDCLAAVKLGVGADMCTIAQNVSADALRNAYPLDRTSLLVAQTLIYTRTDGRNRLALLYANKGPTNWTSGKVFDEIRHQATTPGSTAIS